MSEEKIESESREGEAQAVVEPERWVSKVYLRVGRRRTLRCDNGELFLPPSGNEVRGRHTHPDNHDVIFNFFDDTVPPSVHIRDNASDEASTQVHHGFKIVVGGQEFYVGHWKGPLGADCRTRALELGALAQDEGTWVATKGG